MFADLALACSYSSNTKTPAPSPKTKPSLSLSHGLLALVGFSLLVDNAVTAENPPKPRGVIAISDPPVIMTSQSPCEIDLAENPML